MNLVRPKIYGKSRMRTTTCIMCDGQILEEFKELCFKEGKSMSESLQEFMAEKLEKNALGVSNPISIIYQQNKNLSWIERMPSPDEINTLRADIRSYSDPKKLAWIEAVGRTIHETSRIRYREVKNLR